ncbi:MAG: cohesin domain-containing protein [Candidatus Nealsonbacteria bacterium]
MKYFLLVSCLLLIFSVVFAGLMLTDKVSITVDFFSLFQKFSSRNFLAQVTPAANEAVFYFSPETGAFNTGDSFLVELRMGSSVGIISVNADLNFNSSLMTVVSVSTTDSVFFSWWENSFNNSTGKIQLQASLPSPGFTGDGLIAIINFRAVAAGTGAISYNAGSLALKTDDTNILNLTRSTGVSFTINPPPISDLNAPVCSGGLPTGTLAAGTVQTTISLIVTDATMPVSCRYSTTVNTAYSSMTNNLTNSSGSTYSANVTGLTNGMNYNYYVRCQDAAGNTNTASYPISFSVAASAASTKFTSGDRVSTSAGLYVRLTPSGMLLGGQYMGAQGTIIGGPQFADIYWWWRVDYDTAPDGWSAENWLSAAVSTVSTKFTIGDRITASYPAFVRLTPSNSGTLLGYQAFQKQGTIIGGPQFADTYWWWQIDYDTAPDGWSTEDGLDKVR